MDFLHIFQGNASRKFHVEYVNGRVHEYVFEEILVEFLWNSFLCELSDFWKYPMCSLNTSMKIRKDALTELMMKSFDKLLEFIFSWIYESIWPSPRRSSQKNCKFNLNIDVPKIFLWRGTSGGLVNNHFTEVKLVAIITVVTNFVALKKLFWFYLFFILSNFVAHQWYL